MRTKEGAESQETNVRHQTVIGRQRHRRRFRSVRSGEMQRRTSTTRPILLLLLLFAYQHGIVRRFQEVSYSHLLIPSRIAEPKTPIEDMMLVDATAQPKQHTLSR